MHAFQGLSKNSIKLTIGNWAPGLQAITMMSSNDSLPFFGGLLKPEIGHNIVDMYIIFEK